jgi:hypothetical protein
MRQPIGGDDIGKQIMTATKWTKRSLAAQAMGKIDPTT